MPRLVSLFTVSLCNGHVGGLGQDCSNSIANVLEFCTLTLSHRCDINGSFASSCCQPTEVRITSLCNIWFNILRPRQNGRHFPDDIFKCIPNGPNNNISELVQMMGWHWPGDKPLSELVMVSLLTPICVTRPQRVKHFKTSDVHRPHTWSLLLEKDHFNSSCNGY